MHRYLKRKRDFSAFEHRNIWDDASTHFYTVLSFLGILMQKHYIFTNLKDQSVGISGSEMAHFNQPPCQAGRWLQNCKSPYLESVFSLSILG